jgi:hypothetical protein
MNLDRLIEWAVGIVLVFALTGHIDDLQRWIWRAQAKVIYESRSSNWGSPNFWPKRSLASKDNSKH